MNKLQQILDKSEVIRAGRYQIKVYAADQIRAAYEAGKEGGNGWIDVNERLPEDGKKVIAFGKASGASPNMGRGYTFITHRVEKPPKHLSRHFDENGFLAQYVTHWQPLPQPPQAVQL